jgi:hypothetical protein
MWLAHWWMVRLARLASHWSVSSVVGNDALLVAVLRPDVDEAHVAGTFVGSVLLVPLLAVDAVGPPLERERSSREVREHEGRDLV